MARGRPKTPKLGAKPTDGKQVRIADDPGRHDQETITWRFSIVDQEGLWGWRTMGGNTWWRDVLPKLQNFETMTWAEIQAASGGRSRGNNSHPVGVAGLTEQAKSRLSDLGQDDVAELFSLRLSGTQRIYGIRDRRALKLLWYDPHHGDNNKAVFPVRRR